MVISQLSVITDEISQDFEHTLQVAKRFGITAVEMRGIWKTNIALLKAEELDRIANLLNQYRMQVSVISSPFGKCFLPGSKFANSLKNNLSRNSSYNLSLFDHLIEIAKKFNTKIIRIFNFFKAGTFKIAQPLEIAINILRPYVEKAEKAGIILVLENEHVTLADNIENTLKFLESINSPALRFNLDPGNFYSKGESVDPSAYEKFWKQGLVAHIHVKDPIIRLPVIGSIFDVVGKGKIDYRSLFKQAFDYKYQGYFAFETHSPKNREEKSVASLQYMVQLLDDLKINN
jgi:L-ribulose-5-phosphate 3-epimerase